jgi:hypothetical protein
MNYKNMLCNNNLEALNLVSDAITAFPPVIMALLVLTPLEFFCMYNKLQTMNTGNQISCLTKLDTSGKL